MFRDDADYYIQSLVSFRHVSPHTREAYERDLSKLGNFAMSRKITNVEQMDTELLQEFTDSLIRDGIRPRSLARTLSVLRGFYASLRAEGRIRENYTEGIRLPEEYRTLKKQDPKTLTKEEIAALLSQPDPGTLQGIRDRAILEILCCTGAKTSELTRLRVRDIDLPLGYAVLTGDDGQRRKVPFGEKTDTALRRFLHANEGEYLTRNDPLFMNSDHRPLSRQSIWKMVRRYGKKAGLGDNITPSLLRSAMAGNLLSDGASEETVRRLMGHSRVSVTRRLERKESEDGAFMKKIRRTLST